MNGATRNDVATHNPSAINTIESIVLFVPARAGGEPSSSQKTVSGARSFPARLANPRRGGGGMSPYCG